MTLIEALERLRKLQIALQWEYGYGKDTEAIAVVLNIADEILAEFEK